MCQNHCRHICYLTQQFLWQNHRKSWKCHGNPFNCRFDIIIHWFFSATSQFVGNTPLVGKCSNVYADFRMFAWKSIGNTMETWLLQLFIGPHLTSAPWLLSQLHVDASSEAPVALLTLSAVHPLPSHCPHTAYGWPLSNESRPWYGLAPSYKTEFRSVSLLLHASCSRRGF